MFRSVGSRLFSTQAAVTGFTGAVGNTPLVILLFLPFRQYLLILLIDLPESLIREDWLPDLWQS